MVGKPKSKWQAQWPEPELTSSTANPKPRGCTTSVIWFSTLKTHPCDILLPLRLHLLSLPKQSYQLGTMCSNTWAYEGPFSFGPPQGEVKATEARGSKQLLTTDSQPGSREQCREWCCPECAEQVGSKERIYSFKVRAWWRASSSKTPPLKGVTTSLNKLATWAEY